MIDSMIQSMAPLTMCPQQQALCTVCYALMKAGLPEDVVINRYLFKAKAIKMKTEQGDDAALHSELMVRSSVQLKMKFVWPECCSTCSVISSAT
jgi:hypothetical protein